MNDANRTRKEKLMNILRGHPVRWATLAAGAGLSAGLLSRFLHRRVRRRHEPAIVIVEMVR